MREYSRREGGLNTLPAWNCLEYMYSKRGGASPEIIFQLGTAWSIVEGVEGAYLGIFF
jgi:hypothetical protein